MTEQSIFNTFLGNINLITNEGYLTHCGFVSSNLKAEKAKAHIDIIKQLKAYLKGELKVFNIPLKPDGSTFQKEVWNELINIPYGQTISYGTLANRLGDNANPRNVGGANGANPIAIIIPCHRVIGKNMKLTGYAGGIERKRKLLVLEGAIKQKTLF